VESSVPFTKLILSPVLLDNLEDPQGNRESMITSAFGGSKQHARGKVAIASPTYSDFTSQHDTKSSPPCHPPVLIVIALSDPHQKHALHAAMTSIVPQRARPKTPGIIFCVSHAIAWLHNRKSLTPR
jgi:hypothetical protein